MGIPSSDKLDNKEMSDHETGVSCAGCEGAALCGGYHTQTKANKPEIGS